ncbi:MAG: hypothetical protein J7J32_00285 [Candidatus Atribacteria bacterium]|nr:hypothetical protein [Candidatus Atribacteria bacterium]MCD6349646.1 hypothetical protein [Candidatus Atribacteria bacterium]
MASPEVYVILKSIDKLDRRFAQYEKRILSLEKEIAALKVWGSILSFLIPSLLLSLLLRGLK